MAGRILRLPPVIFIGFAAAGAGAHALAPLWLGVPSFGAGMAFGGGLFLLGAANMFWAIATLRRHRTALEPWERPSTLVSSGPFRLSRNPLYVTLVLFTIALAIMFDSAWLLVSALLVGLTLDRVVIRPEERVLEEVFGEAYRDYKRRVRRWV